VSAGRAGVRARHRRIYYGWVLVVTLALTETTSWGVLYYAFTVFLRPMQEELSWSRGVMTGAFSLALLLSGLAAVPVGRWLDRHGPRLLMTVGSVCATALVLAWAGVRDLWAFYLVWAGIGLAMATVLYEPAFVVVANWFARRRGRALTVLTFIAGFASVIYIPLAGRLVAALGWRQALVVLAALLAVGTVLPHALLLRRRPQDLGLLPDGATTEPAAAVAPKPPRPTGPAERAGRPAPGQPPGVPARVALRGAAFWWLTVAFCLNAVGVLAVNVHLVPYLIDRGHAPENAAGVAGLIGVMALPGRLVLTPLGDRLPRGAVAAALFLLQAVALTVLVLWRNTAGVLAFVALFGAGFGAITPARAALVAEYYGPAAFGTINGVVALFVTAARAVGPVGAGAVYDVIGSYTPLWWALAAVSVLSGGAILMAERAARELPGRQPTTLARERRVR
jgi:MFS family permease